MDNHTLSQFTSGVTKYLDILVVIFVCQDGDLRYGNVATSIERPPRDWKLNTTNRSPTRMAELGKHKATGKSCLHIKKLEDIQIPTLKKLIKKSYKSPVF